MAKRAITLDKLAFQEGDSVWFRADIGSRLIFRVKGLYLKSNGQPMATLACKAWGEHQYALPALLLEKVPADILDKIAKAREAKRHAAEQEKEGRPPQVGSEGERPAGVERPSKPSKPKRFDFDRR